MERSCTWKWPKIVSSNVENNVWVMEHMLRLSPCIVHSTLGTCKEGCYTLDGEDVNMCHVVLWTCVLENKIHMVVVYWYDQHNSLPLSLFFRNIKFMPFSSSFFKNKFMPSFKETSVSYTTSILIVDNSISFLMELIWEGYKIMLTHI